MRRILYILAIVIVSVIVNVNATWATGDIYTRTSVLSTGRWVKIGVTETGINVITPALIQQCGFTDMSRIKVYGYGGALMPDGYSETYLKEHDDLQEVATYSDGGQKYFYGQGPVSWASYQCDYRTRNPYSSYGCYFITEGENPKTCTEEELLTTANDNYASQHTLYEVDDYALIESGANLFNGASLTNGSSVDYNVTVPAAATYAKITIPVAASASGTTFSVSSSLTGETLSGVLNLDTYGKVKTCNCQFEIKSTDLANAQKDASGNYIVPVSVSNINGASSAGTLFIDFVSARYNASNVPTTISGNSFPSATYIYSITNQNHHADEARDLIVIIPSMQGNLTQAQRLCRLHEQRDGITTRIIPADELYSEFSSGTPDISAFRRYLKMLYDRAHVSSSASELKAPKWVLLFGKAYFDNRGITGGTDATNLVPVFETDDLYNSTGTARSTSIATTNSFCSDDYITVLQDNQYANMYGSTSHVPFDIAVGRIPASTDSEAKIYVDKIEHYMDAQYNGKWQRDIMFIGGDANDTEKKSDPFMHIKQINQNADLVIGRQLGYDVKKVLTPSYTPVTSSTGKTYPQATSDIIKQQNNGALIMNYGGHAGTNQLSNEKVLMLSDFQNFSGKHYSVWITAACETMPYDMSAQCLGLEAVKNVSGGAIAFIGTSRTVFAGQNTALNKTLMYHILTYTSSGVPITLGEAMRRTKCSLVGSNGYSNYQGNSDTDKNKHQYNLIGDPALKINLPKDSVVVDDVIGEEGGTVIKGLEKVVIKGHVVNGSDVAQSYSSSARAFIKVYDSASSKVCEEDGSEYPFSSRDITLFEGITKFSGSNFEATFRLPEELNNGGGQAQILVYVLDGGDYSNTAKGQYDGMTVESATEHPVSSSVPEVYCYFNDRNFTSGNTVGATPFFVAELHDDEGLYVSESTGHNLELVIDGSSDMTYNLNSNFTFDYNSYTTGQTWYVLPWLANGYHSARFRVWNILGTMVTKNLSFLVQGNKEPDLINVFVSKNPVEAGTTLYFYVLSDLTGSEANIYIDLFDSAGRLFKVLPFEAQYLGDNLEEKNYEDTRQYRSRTTLSWNVSGLAMGLYIYRVRVTCDGYNYSSKTKKLVVTQ